MATKKLPKQVEVSITINEKTESYSVSTTEETGITENMIRDSVHAATTTLIDKIDTGALAVGQYL
jgi:hypothetical protein